MGLGLRLSLFKPRRTNRSENTGPNGLTEPCLGYGPRGEAVLGKSDRAVYDILLGHGAKLASGTPTAVSLCCSSDVRELLFELNGWGDDDVELTDWRVNTALRYLRNPDAFRWVYEHHPDSINWKTYSVSKMADWDLGLLLAVVETKPDKSVRSKKIPGFMPSLCAGSGYVEPERVLMLARKLKLNKAGLEELARAIDNHPRCNTVAADSVRQYLSDEILRAEQ